MHPLFAIAAMHQVPQGARSGALGQPGQFAQRRLGRRPIRSAMIAAQQQQQVQCGYYAGFTQVSSYPPAPSELPAPPESTCYLVEETWYSPNAPSPVGHPCDYPPPPGHYTWYRDWDIHPQGTGVWRDIYHCPQYQGPPAVGMQSGGMQYQVPGLPDWQQP